MCRNACAGLLWAALCAVVSFPPLAQAGDRCVQCGCCSNLCKVCRVVPETKEEIEVCWDVKCEDFCVPGPSTFCGSVRECDKCGSWCRDIWKPGCAKVYTRRVPVKTEVKRKKQTFKWEVVTICAACRRGCTTAAQDAPLTEKLADAVPSKALDDELPGEEVIEDRRSMGPVVVPVHTARLMK